MQVEIGLANQISNKKFQLVNAEYHFTGTNEKCTREIHFPLITYQTLGTLMMQGDGMTLLRDKFLGQVTP